MARPRIRCCFTMIPRHSLCHFPSRHEWILLLLLLLLLTGVFLPGITSAATAATTTTMMLMVGDNSRMGSWRRSASPRRWSPRNRRRRMAVGRRGSRIGLRRREIVPGGVTARGGYGGGGVRGRVVEPSGRFGVTRRLGHLLIGIGTRQICRRCRRQRCHRSRRRRNKRRSRLVLVDKSSTTS
jgi:hypothetical protein